MSARAAFFTAALMFAIGPHGRAQPAAPPNNVIALLEAGKPAIGVWTGALAAPRIAKVLATSDADFIVADVEHDVYDFQALHTFLLEVADFHHRYRTQARPAPGVHARRRRSLDPAAR